MARVSAKNLPCCENIRFFLVDLVISSVPFFPDRLSLKNFLEKITTSTILYIFHISLYIFFLLILFHTMPLLSHTRSSPNIILIFTCFRYLLLIPSGYFPFHLTNEERQRGTKKHSRQRYPNIDRSGGKKF